MRQYIAVLVGITSLLLTSACSSQEDHLVILSTAHPSPATIVTRSITRLTNSAQSFLPSWSPDGKIIAYFSSEDHNIYLMEADGSNPHRLTDQLETSFGPAVWPPDGTRIAFALNQDGGELYVVRVTGDGLLLLADDLSGPYVWSADGKRIAFVASVGGQDEIALVDADGGNRRSIFRSTASIEALFRPPQAEDVYAILGEDDVYSISRVDLEGADIKRLAALPAGVYDAVISPDGSYIAYLSDDGLGVMRVDGTEQRILINEEGGSPTWSPDGRWIAFAAEVENEDVDIFAVNVDGSGSVDLTQQSGYADFNPVWSPDGSRLAFIACSYVEGLGYSADYQIYSILLTDS